MPSEHAYSSAADSSGWHVVHERAGAFGASPAEEHGLHRREQREVPLAAEPVWNRNGPWLEFSSMGAPDDPATPTLARPDENSVLEPPPRPPPSPAPGHARPNRNSFLVILHSGAPLLIGRRFVLDRSPIRVGRGPENDIVFPDADVSLHHARIEQRDGEWWCANEAATDSVYIDDRSRADATLLVSGMRIGVEAAICKFLSGIDGDVLYHQEIYSLTLIDPLTEVYRERYLVETLEKRRILFERRRRALSVLMIEVDDIDTIVAHPPSSARDRALRAVAGHLRAIVPYGCVLARYGDRFVLVLPETNEEVAREAAEHLRGRLAMAPIVLGPRGPQAHLRVESTPFSLSDSTAAIFLERASAALRAIKSR